MRLYRKHGFIVPPRRGGKVVAPATKGGGDAFPRPSGRLYGFRRQRRYKKWRRRRHTSPVERHFIPPEGGALNPSGRRQPVPDRTLGAQGQRPGGAINPRPRKRASTFGNTGKHRLSPDPDPDLQSLWAPISFLKKTPFPRERSFFSGHYLMSYMPLTPSLRLM